MLVFQKNFTQQEALPEESIEQAIEVMRSGRLHRYNLVNGEKGAANELEERFADYMGKKYCLACSSCGSALYIAMKSLGVKAGETVLCNAYTLAPVPGAIENTGASIELVEINKDYTIDFTDLEKKAVKTKAKFLLLSHMRGHVANMDMVMEICQKHSLTLIEDCAHTLGATWNGKKSGSFGTVACYSTQTYKHMNSGEGGLLVTNNADLIARAILYSGSYMLYGSHTSAPAAEVFEKCKLDTPNYSSRMDHLRAALLLPQLDALEKQCQRWNTLYDHTEALLRTIPGLYSPQRDAREHYVGSSIQFNLPGFSYTQMEHFIAETAKRGVQVKWFGSHEPVGFTSSYESWQYFTGLPELPKTKAVLATMCDMRLPLTFTTTDCSIIVAIIANVLEEMNAKQH